MPLTKLRQKRKEADEKQTYFVRIRSYSCQQYFSPSYEQDLYVSFGLGSHFVFLFPFSWWNSWLHNNLAQTGFIGTHWQEFGCREKKSVETNKPRERDLTNRTANEKHPLQRNLTLSWLKPLKVNFRRVVDKVQIFVIVMIVVKWLMYFFFFCSLCDTFKHVLPQRQVCVCVNYLQSSVCEQPCVFYLVFYIVCSTTETKTRCDDVWADSALSILNQHYFFLQYFLFPAASSVGLPQSPLHRYQQTPWRI